MSPVDAAGLRIPPCADEAERGVLGSILLDPVGAIDKCLAKRLSSSAFYDRRHQTLFEHVVDMTQANVPMDAITIAQWLRDRSALEKVGGYDYLVELQDSTLVDAHVEYYCDIVLEKYLYRRLIDVSSENIDQAYQGMEDASLLLSQAEESLFKLSEHGSDDIPDWKDSIKAAFTDIENTDPNQLLTGVTTGYMGLNERLGGLHKTDMIVLAARPAMGKTSLALNIAENAALGHLAEQGVPVGVFSLEMSREQLVKRMLFSNARIPAHRIKGRRLTPSEHAQLTASVDRLSKAKLYIDDTPGLEAVELRSRARRMKRRYGIELIVIDYLQLMNYSKFSRDGRQRETMAISGAVKAMAKELNVPVIVLSQLSRATEQRGGDNRPKLSDLRDSGAIEQDADVVLLLYRGGYYKEGDERNDDISAIVDVAKYRHGAVGEVKMNFIKEYTRFEDRDEREDEYTPIDD
ncbi:MAG: replicative DNA helicase [Kiritimatiellales bacterium]|nr:replicative DNA helicase [Pontiella sp.]NNJ71304.1 replicative DNA helicase [Kiritimatiellales bacterium]